MNCVFLYHIFLNLPMAPVLLGSAYRTILKNTFVFNSTSYKVLSLSHPHGAHREAGEGRPCSRGTDEDPGSQGA